MVIISVVCRIFEGELPYVNSFLDHYISIGIKTFYILNTIIEQYDTIKKYLINYINTGFVKLYNISSNKVRIQRSVQEILKHVKETYLFYCDIDEYLILPNRFNTIHELVISEKYDQFKIKWIYYFNDEDLFIINKDGLKARNGKCIMKTKSIKQISDHGIYEYKNKLFKKKHTYKIDIKNNPYILHLASRTFNDTLIKCLGGRIRDRKYKSCNLTTFLSNNDIFIKFKLLALYNVIKSHKYNCNIKINFKKINIDYNYEKYLLDKFNIDYNIRKKMKLLYNNFKKNYKLPIKIIEDIKKKEHVRIAITYTSGNLQL